MKQPNEMTDDELNSAMAIEVKGWQIGGNMYIESLPHTYLEEPQYNTVMGISGWYPTADLNQARECVEACNYHIMVRYDPLRDSHKWTVCGHDSKRVADTDNPARAICEAVLQAKRGEK